MRFILLLSITLALQILNCCAILQMYQGERNVGDLWVYQFGLMRVSMMLLKK